MKLPSIQQVLRDAGSTFVRFPFVLCCAILGTAAAVILIDREGYQGASILYNALFATILGVPLFATLALTSEKRRWSRGVSLGAGAVGVLLLVGYALTVPSQIDGAPAYHFYRLAILTMALILFLAVAPFMRAGQLNGFWQYCRMLIFRFVTAVLYASVLQAGLSIALVAVDQLFGVDIAGKRYFELWVILVGVFGPWFFLSGMPDRLESLDEKFDYPKGLKIFAQYIVFPLVIVYFVILYAYLGKILVQWNWPRGWVSGLILGFACSGILTFLMLYPIREQTENAWVRRVSRWFYIVMIPLVVVLFLAASRRIADYGITESRYLLLALGVWLSALVIYFNLSKTKSIKFIPASLCVIAFLVTFGPWSAFAVSEKSQVGRLRSVLERNAALNNGKVLKAPGKVSAEDSRQISSIIAYLHTNHGYDRIQPWFAESLEQDTSGGKSAYKTPSDVVALMGVEYVGSWQVAGERWLSFDADRTQGLDIAGYDRILPVQYVSAGPSSAQFKNGEISYSVSKDLDTLTFRSLRDSTRGETLALNVRPLLDSLMREFNNLSTRDISPSKLTLEGENSDLKVKICLQHIQAEHRKEELKLTSYQANILYRTRTERQ
jgi:hypothetical protein